VSRTDLRLLPGATCVWALAVLGIAAGTAAALAAAAVLVSLALTAVVLTGPSATGRSILAHLSIVVLAGALLFPALQRHEGTHGGLAEAQQQGLVVELTVVAAAEPAPPDSGPAWARGGQRLRARTVQGAAHLGRRAVHLPASVPLLVRASVAPAHELARVRDGDLVHVRGRVAVDGRLIVLRASEVHPVASAGATGRGQTLRHALRRQARQATSSLPGDESALVRGMTIGDTRGMGERTEEIM